MKIDRLFSIVHILLNKKQVTAKELADELEVSTRTIYRDIDTLSASGIPIYTDKGKGGGISLIDGYIFDKSIISSEEKNSIIMGLELLKATNYHDVGKAIKKLNNLLNINKDSYIEVDFSDFESEEEVKIFNDLKDSIASNNVLQITYKASQKGETLRKVNPLKLIFKKQRWYILAYCHFREDYRFFRISRIGNTIVTGEKFNRKDYDITDIVLLYSSKPNQALITLTLDIAALDRVKEEFKSYMIKSVDENKVIISFEAAINSFLVNHTMSFADYLIDISPIDLKEAIKDRARKILKMK